jgi:ribosomal protein S18 acetylase RimI-like enzyme
MVCLHDKNEIELFLRRNVYLHIYGIGDLDDFFWQNTQWYALKENDEIQAIATLYTVDPFPTLLAMSEDKNILQELLRSIFHVLPGKFYLHLSPAVEDVFSGQYELQAHGEHCKMALKDSNLLCDVDCGQVIRLGSDDLEDIQQLYKDSYPGNWFDARMLETEQYFGIRVEDRLVSIAGIHVYSQAYKVAALGNIVTHPDYRNNGFGRCVTAKLCQSLSQNVDHIGLNVKADNETAIAMYKKLGFDIIASYWEYMVEARAALVEDDVKELIE